MCLDQAYAEKRRQGDSDQGSQDTPKTGCKVADRQCEEAAGPGGNPPDRDRLGEIGVAQDLAVKQQVFLEQW